MKVLIESKIYNNSTEELSELKTKAIMNNRKIIYQDNGIKTVLELRDDLIYLNRDLDKGNIEIYFRNLNPKCRLNIENSYIDLDIIINKLDIKENEVNIEYKLEEDIITFDFRYKEII